MTDRPAGADIAVYNWATIPAFDYDGITVRGFRSSNAALAYSHLSPGTPMKPPHSHDFEQVFMLLQGRVKLHIGGSVHDCGPGTVVQNPPHVEHWVEARGRRMAWPSTSISSRRYALIFSG